MTITEDTTAPEETTITEIGASRTRKEDQRLITGRSRYTDNMVLPGMLHLALLRSPFAHATITAIDVKGKALTGRWSRSSPVRTWPTNRAASPPPGRSRPTKATPYCPSQ